MPKLKNDELNRMSIDEFKNSQKHPFVIVLDNIRSMNNIGSIFRTADAFRVEEMLLCGITACPPHREIQRTALDAAESVSWKYFDNTISAIEYLRKTEYSVYAIEQTTNAIDLQNFIPEKEKIAFIFGNEVNGVDDKLLSIADGSIQIPQFGTKHSFNVAVSAGIVLWDIFTKKKLPAG